MKILKSITLLLLAAAVFMPYRAEAKGKKENTVYLFAFGSSFKDSTAYLSAVQELKGVAIDKKTDFLSFRAEYSKQFKSYLNAQLGVPYATCVVFFSKKKDAVEKKYLKVRRKLKLEKRRGIQEIPGTDFAFTLTPQELPDAPEQQ